MNKLNRLIKYLEGEVSRYNRLEELSSRIECASEMRNRAAVFKEVLQEAKKIRGKENESSNE